MPISPVAYSPDFFTVQFLRPHLGTSWRWHTDPQTFLELGEAMSYARTQHGGWKRITKTECVWDAEGENYSAVGNLCLPGLHCVGKSRDCMANGCIRQLQEINAYDGVLMFICGDLIKSGKATK